MKMTKNEKRVLSEFLDELEDGFGDAGCNDYVMENTKENRKLFTDATMFELGCKTEGEFKKHRDYEDFRVDNHIDENEIITQDIKILLYLRNKFNL